MKSKLILTILVIILLITFIPTGLSTVNSQTLPTGCKGDYNANGIVDIQDFSTFGQNYKKVGINCALDITGGDCLLNILDFQQFAQVYKSSSACTITPTVYPINGNGLYESCTPWDTTDYNKCFPRLDQMALGGFKLIANYDEMYGNASGLVAYLDHMQAKGMKDILAINDPSFWNGTNLLARYVDMASTCLKPDKTKCQNNTDFTTYIINLVKGHPALWGYYIGDEIASADHTKLKVFTDLVHQLDPNHPRLIIQTNETNTTNGAAGVTVNLTPFVDTADVIGVDYYPIGSGGYGESLSQTGSVAKEVQRIATLYGKQSAMVLQSFSWAEYPDHDTARCTSCPYPTLSDMQSMLTQTLQNSTPQLILWYSYFDILRSDNPTSHWNDLVSAITR